MASTNTTESKEWIDQGEKNKEKREGEHWDICCGVTDDERALVINIVIFLLSFLCPTLTNGSTLFFNIIQFLLMHILSDVLICFIL